MAQGIGHRRPAARKGCFIVVGSLGTGMPDESNTKEILECSADCKYSKIYLGVVPIQSRLMSRVIAKSRTAVAKEFK